VAVFSVLSLFVVVKCFVVLQSMSQRRQSLKRVLRMRQPATTTAKQRIRSVRRKKDRATSHRAVAIDSFVEDSQGSPSEYYVRKPSRTALVHSDNASTKCNDTPRTAVECVRRGIDTEEDQYNLLESTEELELPCGAVSADETRECRELDGGDVTIVSEMSHVVSDAHDASTADDELAVVADVPADAGTQTPQPPQPPHSDMNQTDFSEHPATSSRQQRLSSLPTLQLDGQLDTPASTVRNHSADVDKVQHIIAC